MKRWLQLGLGILTAVGGFFDVGNIATSAQAGATYRVQLLWPLVVGTLLVIFLVEMSGRFAAVTRKALPDGIREHFGFSFWLIPFSVLTLVHLLVLASEIGGIAFALQLITGVGAAWWAFPVGILAWLLLWRATFSAIENSTSLLGLITIAFIVAAVAHHPPLHDVARGLLPSLPHHGAAKYWFLVVSILGVLLGLALTYAARFALVRVSTLSVDIEPRWILFSLLIGLIGGTIGALYPALRAARQDAVEALSYE